MRHDALDLPGFGPARPLTEKAAPAQGPASAFEEIRDRRKAPRRRLRDRIASLDRTDNPRLARDPQVQNLVLLAEDDLRQTALAIGHLESYLADAMELVESPAVTAEDLATHAASDDALDGLDALSDSLANLRRRLAQIAGLLSSGTAPAE